MMRSSCLAVALGLLTLACGMQPESPTPRLALEPCTLPDLEGEARCGTYEVFEDRATGTGRKIPLRVVVLPATGDAPAPDAVVFFAGGPGGSTVEAAPGIAAFLADARKERDFLLVDYRGTGESAPLFCDYQTEGRGAQDALETFIPVDRLPACRETLEASADLRQYTTPNIVDDIEEVRAALGYPKVNLMGASYGSRAALVYLRRHPESVRTVILEGVVPTDADMPETFARDAQAAFDGVVLECAADADCAAAFPDPAGDLATLLARVETTPPTVPVIDPSTGASVDLPLSHAAVSQTVRYLLYQVPGSLQLPAYLRAAVTGNLEPIAQAAYSVAGNLMASLPDGLYLSVLCAEDVPFIDQAQARADARGTFLGNFRLTAQTEACAAWPRGELPEGFRTPVRSERPVLIISGERDPVTPARWGHQAAEHLPNSRHLVIDDAAHSYFGLEGAECVDALMTETLRTGRVDGLDLDACHRSISRRPFLTALVKEEAIELTEDQRTRVAGTYLGDGNTRFEVVHDDGILRARIFGLDLKLTPLAPLRFRPEGGPPGNYVTFTSRQGAVIGATIEQAGGSPMQFERRPD